MQQNTSVKPGSSQSVSMGTRELRDTIKMFLTSDEQIVMTPNYPPRWAARKKYPVERIPVAIDLVRLLIKTNYINDITKVYLMSGDNYGSIAENLGINEKTARSKVWYSLYKLRKDLACDNIVHKIITGSDLEVEELHKKIREIINTNLIEHSIVNNLIIKIEETNYNDFADIDDDEFDILVDIITPYFKKYVENKMSGLTDNMRKYLWFISSMGGILKDKDLERYNKLKSISNGEVK